MSGSCEDGAGAGHSFGIEGYVVPKEGPASASLSYSMPKAKLTVGSAFAPVGGGAPGPGPCEYFKDSKRFGHRCQGGIINKPGKSSPEKPRQGSAASASGSTKASPMDSDQLMPRVPGGMTSKKERGCYLFDKAASQSKHSVAPGKYSPQYIDAKPRAALFGVRSVGAPKRDKPNFGPEPNLGPGHYEVKKDLCEKKEPIFSVPKNPATSYLDALTKHSGETPGPGHNLGLNLGLYASKVEDREGARMHSARILAEHILTPRRASAAV